MAKYVRTRPGEEWRYIDWLKDKDGNPIEHYFVSNQGRVKKNNKELKQSNNRDGYRICYLNTKPYLVHRLVGQAFIPHPEELDVIDHINECKTDNHVENLRWTTRTQNTNYAHEERKKRNEKKAYYGAFDLLAIDPEDNANLCSNLVEAAHLTGFNEKVIGQVARGNMPSFHSWRFIRIRSFIDRRKKRNVVEEVSNTNDTMDNSRISLNDNNKSNNDK